MILIVMGVAGSGKSTVGSLLAKRLRLPFLEGDAFHPKENIAKMSKGIPLTDEDRYPWLRSLSEVLQREEKSRGAVLACSALKESYRQVLQEKVQGRIVWIYLKGTQDTIRERMKSRSGHFMPEALLPSQFAILEEPEYAHCFPIEEDPATIVTQIINVISKK